MSTLLDNAKRARLMRNEVYKHMLRTRGWKYRIFLRYLRLFKYVAFAPVRGAFLESYYTMMRYLDDVVDGDATLPDGFQHSEEYIEQKIRFSEDPSTPKDKIDHLMTYCFELGRRFNSDFRNETADILNSLLFDARRKGKFMIYSNEELMHHFHLLDIRGTIKATLKIFKEDPRKYTILEPLGTACRFQYDLEDLGSDLAAGYINIPREECELFGITLQDLEDITSPNVVEWMRHRARNGLQLLEEHHKRLPTGHFSWLLRRIVFPQVYEYPAKKVFTKVLSGKRITQPA